MQTWFYILSVLSISVSHAEISKHTTFLGRFEGKCLGRDQGLPMKISIREGDSQLQLDYADSHDSVTHEKVSTQTRTVRDWSSPYPDDVDSFQVSMTEEPKNGVVQSVLTQKICSNREVMRRGKTLRCRTVKLTLTHSLEGMPDQLVVEGGYRYESCLLSRVGGSMAELAIK